MARGNGEGSISKRKDGRWMARVTLPTGKRKALYGKTRAEVAEKMRKLQRNIDDGLPVTSDTLRLGEYLDAWLEGHTIRDSTRHRWKSLLKHVHRRRIARVPLSKLTATQLNRLFAEMQEKDRLAACTVNQLRAVIRKALADAMAEDKVARNVAKLSKPRKDRQTDEDASDGPDSLTRDQAADLITVSKGTQWHALIVCALHTGARQGELVGMKWSDLDLDAGTWDVRRTAVAAGGKLFTNPPKTKRGRRRIHLTSTVIRALQAHRAQQAEQRLRLGPAWSDEGWVWPNAAGGLRRPVTTLRALRRLQDAAGLPRVRFHDLRHTFASLALASGVPVAVVSKQLGHANPSITLNIYTHVLPKDESAAADAVESLLG